MSALALQLLGEFRVLRGGAALSLPPSRKTRALLAYLAIEGRRFRREHLCELLWEVPDDPRGSLRWSLSKLRRLVDDESRRRIVADRTFVAMDTDDVAIDVNDLRALVSNGIGEAPLADLETAATGLRGDFLEGVEFSRFHDFHSWCVAERQRVNADRARVLNELMQRLRDEPERSLPYARAVVSLAPYDEHARANLVRLLAAAGRASEAAEQVQLGLRMLQEAGVTPEGVLRAAARTRPASEAVAVPRGRARDAGSRRASAVQVVGRDSELARIADAWDGVVRDRRAHAVALLGAPGIGKSHILGCSTQTIDGSACLTLRAAAFEADTVRPFGLWIDALRALGGDHYEQVFGIDDAGNRERLFGGLADFVALQAEKAPVVLAFDDVHWCDESSAAALHYVARMNRDRPLFAMVSVRSEELRDNAALLQALRGLRREGLLREMALGPLGEDALQALIAQHVPDVDSEALSAQCAGNPLLAIELARAVQEGASGSSLSDWLRERLARYSTNGAEVLRWASALVPPFDLQTLVRITEIEAGEVGDVLDTAQAEAMLVRDEKGLRFSHQLIGKAIYNEISPLRRQVMHRKVAESMVAHVSSQNLDATAWLVHHATLSDDPALAARSMVAAGQLSLRFFANEEARTLANKGLQFARTLGDAQRIPLEIELHEILFSSAPLEDWSAAAERYTALAERALDLGELRHARRGYHLAATVRWSQGEWDGARRQSLQSARVVRGDGSNTQIVGMAETAKCLVMLERDLSDADAMLMEAEAMARRRKFAHPAIYAGIGMLRLHANRLDEAEELFQESRTLCKSAGDRLNEFLAEEYLVVISLQRGRTDEACRRARRLAELGNKIREGSEKPFAEALLGLCALANDDDSSALELALESLRLADAKYRLAYTLTRAALIDVARGRKDAASARAEEALACARVLNRPTEKLLAHAVLASTLARENAARADGHATAVTALLPDAAVWAADVVERIQSTA